MSADVYYAGARGKRNDEYLAAGGDVSGGLKVHDAVVDDGLRVGGAGAGVRQRIEHVDTLVVLEIGVPSDSEQTSVAGGVDRELGKRVGQKHAVGDHANAPAVFLGVKHAPVVGERQRRGEIGTAYHELGIQVLGHRQRRDLAGGPNAGQPERDRDQRDQPGAVAERHLVHSSLRSRG